MAGTEHNMLWTVTRYLWSAIETIRGLMGHAFVFYGSLYEAVHFLFIEDNRRTDHEKAY